MEESGKDFKAKMESKLKIFLVIPVYNEETVIEKVIKNLSDYPYSIVVVDDGSTDRTFQLLQKFQIHRLHHQINLGQGAALQTGMTYALDQEADVIVHFDADGQHRAEDIEKIIEPVLKGEADVALGSRFLRYEDEKEIPLRRRLFLKVAAIVNGFLTGLWLTDAHNGLRALSRSSIEKIYLFENGYSHASEIVQQIRCNGLRYKEVPVRIRYTKYSRTKGQSFWNGFNIVVDMMLRGILK